MIFAKSSSDNCLTFQVITLLYDPTMQCQKLIILPSQADELLTLIADAHGHKNKKETIIVTVTIV